jgi:hypothetical protein
MSTRFTQSKYIKKIRLFLSRWFMLWAPLFLLDFLPVITKWLRVHDQVTIQDLLLPFILSLILSVIIAAIFFHTFVKNRFAALFGGLVCILLLNQFYESWLSVIISKVQSHGGRSHLVFFFVAVIALAYALYIFFYTLTLKWRKVTDVIAKAAFIAISVAFLIQFYSLVKYAIVEWPQFFYRPPSLSGQLSSASLADKPDIYYIVLDRYVSQSVLQKQFNFDNSEFLNWLGTNGFAVNNEAYSNYPFTTMSIASTLSANYNSDQVKKFSQAGYQTVQPYHDAIHYSSVIKQLKSLGYSYYHLGTWYEATSAAPLADHFYQPDGQLTVFNHTYSLSGLMKDKFYITIFHVLTLGELKIGKYTIFNFSQQEASAATLSKFELLKKIADEPAGGRFIFAHILSPHYPYFFKADGSRARNPLLNNLEKPVKQKYTGQMQFVNSQMKIIIDAINKKSNGQAVIILQSDEGEYPMYLNHEQFSLNAENELSDSDMLQWSDDDLQMKYGILAAYHVPKADKQALLDGGDSVNIFRLVLNTYFNANLPYLPQCYYAYPNGRSKPFRFVDITKRLTGQDNPACSGNGS